MPTTSIAAAILENVRASRPDATREQVLEALQAAQCDDILEKLPKGVDTVLGTKGVYLSGGEQQRIALARAILKDAPIVLLDEATAFADPENEHKIQMAFERLTKGKTVLMIAHRLPTIQNADEILVLEQGDAAERGTHDSLMARNGIYASMWRDYQTSVAWNIGKEGHHASYPISSLSCSQQSHFMEFHCKCSNGGIRSVAEAGQKGVTSV